MELLQEADRVAKKYHISYCIIAGTMLGAVRHGGFIPWDDDVDIAMLRSEYERFREACKKELDPQKFYFQDHTVTAGYRWGYGKLRRKGSLFLREHQEHMPYEQGVFMDVFPLDYCCAQGKLHEVRDDLRAAIKEYRTYYLRRQNKDSIETIKKRKTEIFSKYEKLNNGRYKVFFRSCEFTEVEIYNDEETIFPLIDEEFEGYKFPVPQKSDVYLTGFYGDYMSFPTKGLQAHVDPDGKKASLRALSNGINMDEVTSYLKEVYENI